MQESKGGEREREREREKNEGDFYSITKNSCIHYNDAHRAVYIQQD